MEYKELHFEIKKRVAYIVLDHPASRNALSVNMKHELENVISVIEQDDDIWGVIITGRGKAFSSGTDVNEFPATVEEARRITDFSQKLFNRIEELEKPVIAAVNGYALGGGLELALCCDFMVMAESAKIGFPEVKLCAIPCYGGTARLTRMIGAGKAKEMIYTGEMINAGEALAMGLVNYVVPDACVVEKAEEIMEKILANAPMAVSYAKQCINRGMEEGLQSGLDMEKHLVSMLVATADLKEGSRAFLEKRKPVYQNC